jgi:predicted phosphohydrolase
MKLAWITDIHLNFVDFDTKQKFYESLFVNAIDAIAISGDIDEALTLSNTLIEMTRHILKPIYFVLGNHDYYRGSVTGLRKEIKALCKKTSQLHWLPESKEIELTKSTALIGEDCWADGRYGDYASSQVVLNDSHMIKELYQGNKLGKYQLLEVMQKFADFDANRLKGNLELAVSKQEIEKVIVLIHVPPFKESCMYEGKISGDDYLPFFSSKATGDVLLEVAKKNPKIEFLVLCGHTHSKSYYNPLSNLVVKAGISEYRYPKIQEIIEV